MASVRGVLARQAYARMLHAPPIVPVPSWTSCSCSSGTKRVGRPKLRHAGTMVKAAKFQPLGKVILQEAIEIGGVLYESAVAVHALTVEVRFGASESSGGSAWKE